MTLEFASSKLKKAILKQPFKNVNILQLRGVLASGFI